MKASGDTYKQLAKRLGNEELAVVTLVPSDFVFTLAGNADVDWLEGFKGSFKNEFKLNGESEYYNPKSDAIGITGVLTSVLPDTPDGKHRADATDLYFDIANDPVANKEIDLTDFSQFTTSGRILDVLVALMSGGSLEGTLTLNDDLTTDISISDCGKALQLQSEMAHARRNYADQATIEGYTQQLNELVSAQMTCKGVNQVIPMKLQTEKFGVDYWAMPAFNFADEQGYVPFTQLLDKESVEYAINIVDHAAEPMAGAIVTVRQLMQFVQTFMMQMRVNQARTGNQQ